MNENDARNLAKLYDRRRTTSDMIEYARRTDAFREAAEKHFSGTGYNSSLRDAVGGTNDMGSLMKRAIITELESRFVEIEAEITKMGGDL